MFQMNDREDDWQIRPYQEHDRAAVWQLAADTAFFGAPIEAFLDDRTAFCEAFVAYYTDYEPEHLWVAEQNGHVVGYVSGGTNRRRAQVMVWHILPRVIGRWLRGQYRVGRKTLRFVWHSFCAWLQREVPGISSVRFPAHLHINVAATARGQGIGQALLRVCLARFWAEGVPGVHLHTTDQNRAACRLYERLGFRLLKARKTNLWNDLIGTPVENRAYGIVPAWQIPFARSESEKAAV